MRLLRHKPHAVAPAVPQSTPPPVSATPQVDVEAMRAEFLSIVEEVRGLSEDLARLKG